MARLLLALAKRFAREGLAADDDDEAHRLLAIAEALWMAAREVPTRPPPN